LSHHQSSSDSSFRSPETPEKTGKGHTPYKRLAVLLGAAKTGVKDENKTEFIAISRQIRWVSD
jgi:hypothetical protein